MSEGRTCPKGAKVDSDEAPRPSTRFPSALAVFDERDRPRPEILRVSLRHRATSPLLSKQPESDLRASGNPLICSDSHQPKTALVSASNERLLGEWPIGRARRVNRRGQKTRDRFYEVTER